MDVCFVLFYFVLFYFILFLIFKYMYKISDNWNEQDVLNFLLCGTSLFYFVLFCFILFYFVLFYFILFYSILFYFVFLFVFINFSVKKSSGGKFRSIDLQVMSLPRCHCATPLSHKNQLESLNSHKFSWELDIKIIRNFYF